MLFRVGDIVSLEYYQPPPFGKRSVRPPVLDVDTVLQGFRDLPPMSLETIAAAYSRPTNSQPANSFSLGSAGSKGSTSTSSAAATKAGGSVGYVEYGDDSEGVLDTIIEEDGTSGEANSVAGTPVGTVGATPAPADSTMSSVAPVNPADVAAQLTSAVQQQSGSAMACEVDIECDPTYATEKQSIVQILGVSPSGSTFCTGVE